MKILNTGIDTILDGWYHSLERPHLFVKYEDGEQIGGTNNRACPGTKSGYTFKEYPKEEDLNKRIHLYKLNIPEQWPWVWPWVSGEIFPFISEWEGQDKLPFYMDKNEKYFTDGQSKKSMAFNHDIARLPLLKANTLRKEAWIRTSHPLHLLED